MLDDGSDAKETDVCNHALITRLMSLSIEDKQSAEQRREQQTDRNPGGGFTEVGQIENSLRIAGATSSIWSIASLSSSC